MTLDDYEGALVDLDRAVAAFPASGEAFYLRSQCRRWLEDDAGADEDLRRSAELGWADAQRELSPEPQ